MLGPWPYPESYLDSRLYILRIKSTIHTDRSHNTASVHTNILPKKIYSTRNGRPEHILKVFENIIGVKMDEVPEAFEKTPPILMIREDLELISEDPCDTPPSTSGTDKETTNIVNLDLITGSCSSIRNRAVEENQRVIETISEPSVDAEDSHVTAKPSTSSSDQLESKRDVEVVIDKLCEDVTKNEEDFIQVTTPENVTIRVRVI